MSIKENSYYHLAIDTYKTVNNMHNQNVTQIFSFKYYTESNTRSKNRIIVPKILNSYGERSIYYRAAKVWNSIDNEIKLLNFVNFRKRLKENILANRDG